MGRKEHHFKGQELGDKKNGENHGDERLLGIPKMHLAKFQEISEISPALRKRVSQIRSNLKTNLTNVFYRSCIITIHRVWPKRPYRSLINHSTKLKKLSGGLGFDCPDFATRFSRHQFRIRKPTWTH